MLNFDVKSKKLIGKISDREGAKELLLNMYNEYFDNGNVESISINKFMEMIDRIMEEKSFYFIVEKNGERNLINVKAHDYINIKSENSDGIVYKSIIIDGLSKKSRSNFRYREVEVLPEEKGLIIHNYYLNNQNHFLFGNSEFYNEQSLRIFDNNVINPYNIYFNSDYFDDLELFPDDMVECYPKSSKSVLKDIKDYKIKVTEKQKVLKR